MPTNTQYYDCVHPSVISYVHRQLFNYDWTTSAPLDLGGYAWAGEGGTFLRPEAGGRGDLRFTAKCV